MAIEIAKHVYSIRGDDILIKPGHVVRKILELKKDFDGDYVVVCYVEHELWDDIKKKYRHGTTYFYSVYLDEFTQNRLYFYGLSKKFGFAKHRPFLKTTEAQLLKIVEAVEKDCEVAND